MLWYYAGDLGLDLLQRNYFISSCWQFFMNILDFENLWTPAAHLGCYHFKTFSLQTVSYWLKSISSTSILHLHKYIHSHGDTRSCLCRIKSLNSGSDVSTQLTQLGGSDRATQYQPFWSITVVLGLFVAIVQLLSNTLVFSFHTVTEPKHILIQLI